MVALTDSMKFYVPSLVSTLGAEPPKLYTKGVAKLD